MVQTPNGLKAIETFKPCDLVYSKDQFTQAPGVRPVVGTKQTLDQLLYEVVVKNAQGQTETYTTTSEHPFWVTNGPANGQWLKASLLQAGLHLTNALGETLEVVSQTALEQTATVYNIEVHEHSTYHVGEMGVWVHNADCCNFGKLSATEIAAAPKGSVLVPGTGEIPPIIKGGTVELFTNESGPKVPGAVAVGPSTPNAVSADATNMPKIPSGSQAQVVANNPYLPAGTGTKRMMDYLPEAARITQSGGEIVIN